MRKLESHFNFINNNLEVLLASTECFEDRCMRGTYNLTVIFSTVGNVSETCFIQENRVAEQLTS